MNHELLLPGHLFTMFVKEKLEEVRGMVLEYSPLIGNR